MVDAIVSIVLEQLISTTVEEAKERVRLVTGVDKEVNSLRKDFEAIRAVMVDAEERQWKEETVRLWLEKLKHASYDMEDLLDEWNTARLKLKIKDSQTKKLQMDKACRRITGKIQTMYPMLCLWVGVETVVQLSLVVS